MLPHLVGEAGFLGAGHEMVGKHAYPATLGGAEFGEPVGEVVESFKVFDNNAFDAKVVAPDFFDNSGVVHAFHPDAGWGGNFCGGVYHPGGAGVGALGPGDWLGFGEGGADAVDEERAGPEFEKAGFPLVVFEPDKVAVVGFFMADDGPHIAVGKHFHHLTESGGLGWVGGGCGFAGEYVAVVSHAA